MLANSDMNFTSEDPDNFLLNTPNANINTEDLSAGPGLLARKRG